MCAWGAFEFVLVPCFLVQEAPWSQEADLCQGGVQSQDYTFTALVDTISILKICLQVEIHCFCCPATEDTETETDRVIASGQQMPGRAGAGPQPPWAFGFYTCDVTVLKEMILEDTLSPASCVCVQYGFPDSPWVLPPQHQAMVNSDLIPKSINKL